MKKIGSGQANQITANMGVIAGIAAVLLLTTNVSTAQSFRVIEATIDDVQAALTSGEITCRELVELYLERIEAYDQQGPYVWRVTSESLAERVAVTLGIRLPGEVEISQGLAAGDRVVSAGTHKVRPGEPLQFESEKDTGGDRT